MSRSDARDVSTPIDQPASNEATANFDAAHLPNSSPRGGVAGGNHDVVAVSADGKHTPAHLSHGTKRGGRGRAIPNVRLAPHRFSRFHVQLVNSIVGENEQRRGLASRRQRSIHPVRPTTTAHPPRGAREL